MSLEPLHQFAPVFQQKHKNSDSDQDEQRELSPVPQISSGQIAGVVPPVLLPTAPRPSWLGFSYAVRVGSVRLLHQNETAEWKC